MHEQFVLTLINYILDLPDGQIELLRERLITDSVKEPPLEDPPVPLVKDPLIDQTLDFRP